MKGTHNICTHSKKNNMNTCWLSFLIALFKPINRMIWSLYCSQYFWWNGEIQNKLWNTRHQQNFLNWSFIQNYTWSYMFLNSIFQKVYFKKSFVLKIILQEAQYSYWQTNFSTQVLDLIGVSKTNQQQWHFLHWPVEKLAAVTLLFDRLNKQTRLYSCSQTQDWNFQAALVLNLLRYINNWINLH